MTDDESETFDLTIQVHDAYHNHPVLVITDGLYQISFPFAPLETLAAQWEWLRNCVDTALVFWQSEFGDQSLPGSRTQSNARFLAETERRAETDDQVRFELEHGYYDWARP